jgi:hypothetical protein
MRIFSKILLASLAIVSLASVAAADNIYDRDLVRGFLTLKGDLRFQKSSGVKLINEVTEESYAKEFVDGHVEIGASYNRLLTWFDIDFMPLTPKRGDTEWFTYGATWMWGYRLLPSPMIFNIIPSIGPGFELLNIRTSQENRILSSIAPTLNLELELRIQGKQLSAGIYGGYKIIRHDMWDDNTNRNSSEPFPSGREINADKAFVGLKFTWTMLNNFQKRERDLQ